MSDPMTPVDEQPPGETSTDEVQAESAPKPASIGMGAAIGFGAGIGLVFGTMLGSLALGLACGAGLGAVAGAVMESSRKRH
ncbi:MAG: hypothetical protein WC709_09805 [Thermoleophilia bacterium]